MVFTMSHFYAITWDESLMEYDTPRVDYYMCNSPSKMIETDVERQREYRRNNYKTTAKNS